MFIDALFIIDRNWNQSSSLNRRMDEENVVHLHIFFKKNGIMKFADKWMKLEKKISRGNPDPEK